MTLQEQLKQAEKDLFEAQMSDGIGGHKEIESARIRVNQLKEQIANEGK